MTARTIAPPAPPAVGTAAPRGPLLRLRLSDGYTWAHEFTASDAESLMSGCFVAWAACGREWERRALALPAHQTIKREAMRRAAPGVLALHVRDDFTHGAASWVAAKRDAMKVIVVRDPARVDPCASSDWAGAWLACLKTWNGCYELARFLNRTVPAMLRDGLSEA